MASSLPTLLGSSASLVAGRRDISRVERVTEHEVALVRARARVITERGRANSRAIEDVAIDAMQAGAQVTRYATALAGVCPVSEPMLRSIVDQTGLALGQVVSDTGRDLR